MPGDLQSGVTFAFYTMLREIHPKLPMRDKTATRRFYISELGFEDIGAMDYPGYLILRKDQVEIHFFEFKNLDPFENYGQVYIRLEGIDALFANYQQKGVRFSGSGNLETKPWGQKEFSVLDPDHNLLTFGEEVQY
jgi:hypothetical protein